MAIGDFGAGGGHYSQWLNETGLLEAFAFDGTHQAAELTDGLVQEVRLGNGRTNPFVAVFGALSRSRRCPIRFSAL